MKRITIEISDEDAKLIEQVLQRSARSECNSHGSLTLEKLAVMLLEDVALSVRRPGSWEGANINQVLSSHGY